eukprot:jgi/Chrzof1/7793/Cz02g36270.t1
MAMASHVLRDCIRSTTAPAEPEQLLKVPMEEKLAEMQIVCNIVYPSKEDTRQDITVANLENLLQIGSKYNMPKVISMCETFYIDNVNKFVSGKWGGVLAASSLLS